MLPQSPVTQLHEEIHIKDEPLIKDEFESSTESSNFSTHLESSTIKDLFCEQCKLQFDKKIVYDIHLKIVHKKDTIVPIETSCSLKGNMKMHVSMVHEGKKLFECTDCNKTFTLKRNLYRHSVTTKHSYPFSLKEKINREAKFDCEMCGKKFMKKQSMQQHIAAIHEGKKPHKCSICGVAFGYQKTLNRHKQLVHD